MIIVRLSGGLGNQMFQYAAARRLSIKHEVPLKVELSWFEKQQLRQYKLGCFDVCQDFVTPQEIDVIVSNYSPTKWLAIKVLNKLGFQTSPENMAIRRGTEAIIENYGFGKLLSTRAKRNLYFRHISAEFYQKGRIFKEKHFHFDPELLNAPNYIYLDGLWQSEKYFLDIEAIIRQEFTLSDAQASSLEEVSRRMTDICSVSLHVRRGDMANNPTANLLHGTCDLSYYERAVDFMTDSLDQPHFFVFSDDVNWVKENLNLKCPFTLVSSSQVLKDYEELHLMSRCRHHVIANSSFSWWGAWLNSRSDKRVIAPKQWFNAYAFEHDTKDLTPGSWIRL